MMGAWVVEWFRQVLAALGLRREEGKDDDQAR